MLFFFCVCNFILGCPIWGFSHINRGLRSKRNAQRRKKTICCPSSPPKIKLLLLSFLCIYRFMIDCLLCLRGNSGHCSKRKSANTEPFHPVQQWIPQVDLSFLTRLDEIQTQKGSNEHLFILTRTHSMQTVREIPFVKPQNCVSMLSKRLFEPFCLWILFQNASSHSVSDFYFFISG